MLTAASAVKQSMSIVIVTPDGRIRRANLLGTSADGVAVLQPIGRLDGEPVELAAGGPRPEGGAGPDRLHRGRQTDHQADRFGRRADGAERGDERGQARRPGGRQGRPTGRTGRRRHGPGQHDRRRSRSCAGTSCRRSTGITVAPGGTCGQSHGPQNAIVPELQVASTPRAGEVADPARQLLDPGEQAGLPAPAVAVLREADAVAHRVRDRSGHRTSYFFDPKLTEVSPGRLVRAVSYNVLFAPTGRRRGPDLQPDGRAVPTGPGGRQAGDRPGGRWPLR